MSDPSLMVPSGNVLRAKSDQGKHGCDDSCYEESDDSDCQEGECKCQLTWRELHFDVALNCVEKEFENLDQLQAFLDDPRNAWKCSMGIGCLVQNLRVVLRLQLSNPVMWCGHPALIIQQITVEEPRQGLGTTACLSLSRMAQRLQTKRCLMLQCPITSGGKALAAKINAVDPFARGQNILCVQKLE